jgi:hypothetical protein
MEFLAALDVAALAGYFTIGAYILATRMLISLW